MKKHTTAKRNQQVLTKTEKKQIVEMAANRRLTIGSDLGDRTRGGRGPPTPRPSGSGPHRPRDELAVVVQEMQKSVVTRLEKVYMCVRSECRTGRFWRRNSSSGGWELSGPRSG